MHGEISRKSEKQSKMEELGCEKAWWDKLRRPYLKNLETVLIDVQAGRDVRERDLRRALFLLLRDHRFVPGMPILTGLTSDESVAKLEQSLCEASSAVAALRLPRRVDGKIETSTLFLLFYRGMVANLKAAEAGRSSVPFDPWAWLELLQQYAARLEEKLDHLLETCNAGPRRGGRHPEQGVDDECLILATLSALALRAVKTSFRSTYVQIPWEEVEFVLVSFIEAHTVYESWAFVFATVSTVLRYLRDFRAHLAVLKTQHSGRKMAKLSRAPTVSRPAFLAGLNASDDEGDRRKAAMFRDCAVVRDYESLKTIKEALGVAMGALGMTEADYRQRGCLAFHRALFVVGERMKNSWESPNLSARYGKLIETMASENLVATMTRIRNGLAHPAGAAESSAAVKLATKEVKRRMATDLLNIWETVGALLHDAEWDLLKGFWEYSAPHCDLIRALTCTLKYKARGINPIQAELSRLLDAISRRNPTVAKTVFQPFKESKEHSKGLNRQRFLHGLGGRTLLSSLLTSHTSGGKQAELCKLISTVPFSEDVAKFARLWRLSQSGEEIATFQSSLADGAAKKPSSEDVALAMAAIQALPDQHDMVARYTLEGAVRILASAWHESQERRQPLATLFAPCLFGRHLRNYLNHGDKFLQVCFDPDSEIKGIWIMLTSEVDDRTPTLEALRGAQPRPVPLDEAKSEHDRLLRLVQLKCGMFQCARAGDVAGVARAAEGGADLASRDAQGRTLLHAAAAAGQVAVVRWLLAVGPQAVQPRAGDWLGRTALHEASTATVAEALLQAGLPAEALDSRFQTPLSRAAIAGRAEVVRLLVGHPWRADHSALDLHSRKPMHWAAWHGHVEVLQVLLEAGATCEAVGGDAVTPLRLAARGGHADAVRFLLGPRARPRPSDQECLDAIGAAAISGHAVAFHVLLEEVRRRTPARRWAAAVREFHSEVFEGGDSDVINVFLRECPLDLGPLRERQDKLSLLELAAMVGAEHSVNALLARRAEPTARRNPLAMTALHLAVYGGSLDVVRAILGRIPKGHSLRTGRGELMSPLGLALRVNRLDVVRLLVQEGADVNAQPSKGIPVNPLLQAALFGNAEAVGFLLERGARWPRTAVAWTPLHAAALNGYLGIVKLLVPAELPKDAAEVRQSLSLVQCADESGWTALLCALWCGSPAVVKYLLRREGELLQRAGATRGRHCSALQRDKRGRSVLHLCAVWGCAPNLVEAVLHFLKEHGPAAGMGADDLLATVKAVRAMSIQDGRDDGQMVHLLDKWISILDPQSSVTSAVGPLESLDSAPPKAPKKKGKRKAKGIDENFAVSEGEGLKKSAEENLQTPSPSPAGPVSEDGLVVDRVTDAEKVDHSLELQSVAGVIATIESLDTASPKELQKGMQKKTKRIDRNSVVPDGSGPLGSAQEYHQTPSENPACPVSKDNLVVDNVGCRLEQHYVAGGVAPLESPKQPKKERKQSSSVPDGGSFRNDTDGNDQKSSGNSTAFSNECSLMVGHVAEVEKVDLKPEQQSVGESSDIARAPPKALKKKTRKKSEAAIQNSAAREGDVATKGAEGKDRNLPVNPAASDDDDWLVVDHLFDPWPAPGAKVVDYSSEKKDITQKVLRKGVRRLSSLWCPIDPAWNMALLRAAAPTVEALHVRVVQAEHLSVIHAMPRLRRLYVACDPDLYANPISLPPLPAGHPGGLHWVRAYMPKATLASLVRGHAHSLRELVVCAGTRGPPGYEDHYPYACTDLSAVFRGGALPALRRVVLWRSASFVHGEVDCRVQLAAIRAVLGAAVAVVCTGCTKNVREDRFHEL
ncbi:uncharacterized protein LOC117644852 [Thrips palmi]|uniref:Uncharacterized protein LOC117644852 n=1 Tax=Thrips palmi TaxID=161013 RepID=A0A6P8YTG0_THRPL|nr:uncharacterized protein LOC117644852 [Thrips palmi]